MIMKQERYRYTPFVCYSEMTDYLCIARLCCGQLWWEPMGKGENHQSHKKNQLEDYRIILIGGFFQRKEGKFHLEDKTVICGSVCLKGD